MPKLAASLFDAIHDRQLCCRTTNSLFQRDQDLSDKATFKHIRVLPYQAGTNLARLVAVE